MAFTGHYVKPGLTVDAVNTAMAGIITKNIFAQDGMDLISNLARPPIVTPRASRKAWGFWRSVTRSRALSIWRCSWALLGGLLGGWDGFLLYLTAFVVLDYLTGVLAAAWHLRLSSAPPIGNKPG